MIYDLINRRPLSVRDYVSFNKGWSMNHGILEILGQSVLKFNWGAWLGWSLTLFCPMRNSGLMTIGKTHPV